MRFHLEDVSVMPRVLELFKQRQGSYPVKIKVTVDDVEIGRDYGVIEFVDGMLSYTGLRTSFSFARSSARLLDRWQPGFETELWFVDDESESLVLSIDSISRVDPDDYYSLTPKYKRSLKAWLRLDKKKEEVEVLPPHRVSFRSDFRRAPDQYMWLGMLPFLTLKATEWLATLPQPYNLLSYSVPPIVAVAAIAYVANRRRRSAQVLEKYSANSASLSQ
jgi:hypothetical protein